MLPDVPLKLESILQKALRKNSDERYQTINEMLADLRALKGELETESSLPQTKVRAESIVSKIKRHKRGVLLTLAAALLAAAAVAYSVFFVAPAPLPNEKSIAVLPFENLSEEKSNAYFADGIQDEILTRLSKIADLKVISRTSTQRYKKTSQKLSEIAKQLGVANLLEGSVQKTNDQVRVNVQLIRAANDSHLWAETFDRKLTDIFSVESEVAKAIADQLRAKLTGQEEQVIAARPTDNPEAYDAYLRGLAYTLKTGDSPANTLGAQKYLKEAVRLDPKFALGWALLSYVDALGYLTLTLQPTAALREEARQAAETALTLQPNLGEAIVAKGYYYYACLKDYDTAVRYFEQARQFLPNSSQIPESLAYVARRRGQWDRSESYFNEAERLDPRNVNLLASHATSFIILRRFPEALRKLDQVLDIIPDDVDTLAEKAAIAQAEGDLPRAAALLAPLHPNADDTIALGTQVYQAILERRPAQIIPRLKEILAKPDPALGYFNGELRFWLGWAQEVAGDPAAAQESLRQARGELEPFLKEQPENHNLIGDLALTNMGLGDKAAALALSDRAMTVIPIEKDVVDGPVPIEILARVAAKYRRARPRHCRVTETTLDTVRGPTGFEPAAYSCSAPARSNVRSAPERSALRKIDIRTYPKTSLRLIVCCLRQRWIPSPQLCANCLNVLLSHASKSRIVCWPSLITTGTRIYRPFPLELLPCKIRQAGPRSRESRRCAKCDFPRSSRVFRRSCRFRKSCEENTTRHHP